MHGYNQQGQYWDLLYSYMVLAEHGKMRKAAGALSVSTSTLSRRMEKLELVLNISLFRRHPDGIVLTEEGRQLAEHCKTLDSNLTDIIQSIRHYNSSSPKIIRCSIVADIARFIVLPHLQEFYRDNANVMIEIDTAMQLVDLVSEDWDLAIRFSRPEKGALVVKRLASTRISLYRHKDMEIDLQVPIPFIGWHIRDADFLPNKLIQNVGNWHEALRVSDFSEALAAMQAGIGTGFMPDYVARQLNEYVPVALPNTNQLVNIWLVVREASSRQPHVRKFMQFIDDILHQHNGLNLN
ncbi:LysR family transcriptional regulator [Thalassotalea fusca]